MPFQFCSRSVAFSGVTTTPSIRRRSRPRTFPGTERQDRRSFQSVQSVGVLTDAPDNQETARNHRVPGDQHYRQSPSEGHSGTREPERPTSRRFAITGGPRCRTVPLPLARLPQRCTVCGDTFFMFTSFCCTVF